MQDLDKTKESKENSKKPLLGNFRLRKGIFFTFAFLIEAILLINLSFLLQRQNLILKADTTTPQENYDVIIIGAGTGGTSAAIQAARLGAKVALIEETGWVGGQMTAAGVSTMDRGGTAQTYTGLYKEFYENVKNYYTGKGISINERFEARVAKDILMGMINNESNITLLLNTRVDPANPVITDPNNSLKITSIRLQDGRVFGSKILIDATEYGDVLAKSPASYRIGNLTKETVSSNPNACIQDITYNAIVKKYPRTDPNISGSGVPADLLIPESATPSALSYVNTIKAFCDHVTVDGLPIAGCTDLGPNVNPMWNFNQNNAYRAVPDTSSSSVSGQITRTGVNFANDYPAEYAYMVPAGFTNTTLKVQYLEDPAYRKKANCEAKLKTLQFIYYMQNELGQKDWAIADDEGYNSPDADLCANSSDPSIADAFRGFENIERNFPLIPYVREGRRAIGPKTLTAKDIKRVLAADGKTYMSQTAFQASVAVGDYPDDLHNCKTSPDLETSMESLSDIPESNVAGSFQVPLEVFLPMTASNQYVDGFLVAEKNLSTSRLANGATRLQPITMNTGQAAGAIAALAVKNGKQPRELKAMQVQQELLDKKDNLIRQNYTDAPETYTYWKAVQLNNLYGIMQGNGIDTFMVNSNLTRQEAAVVIINLFQYSTIDIPLTSDFADVNTTDWSYKYIETLYKQGLTSGCGLNPRIFCPTRTITRVEMFTLWARALEKLGLVDTLNIPSTPTFTDMPTTHWGYKYIEALYKKGIVAGCSTSPMKICPDDLFNRGLVALVNLRILPLIR